MQAINLKVKVNDKQLDRLKNIETNYQQSIINDSLLTQLVLIYLNTLTLTLKNEIKSELITNYLKTARLAFNENFNLVKLEELNLRLLVSEKAVEFKTALALESELVQDLVRSLNKVFIIQYDNYSWQTFNFFYYINDDKIKDIHKNIEKILKQANKINENFDLATTFSEQENSFNIKEKKVEPFLLLEEKSDFNMFLILVPSKIS